MTELQSQTLYNTNAKVTILTNNKRWKNRNNAKEKGLKRKNRQNKAFLMQRRNKKLFKAKNARKGE